MLQLMCLLCVKVHTYIHSSSSSSNQILAQLPHIVRNGGHTLTFIVEPQTHQTFLVFFLIQTQIQNFRKYNQYNKHAQLYIHTQPLSSFIAESRIKVIINLFSLYVSYYSDLGCFW